ncbi:MAG TPA: ECF-type sigma factor [Gemmataceae bacterium]|nr:ECF-type sigma factor [Gemmataceae bacterium]
MSSTGSVTTWVEQLRAGNRAAAQQLWERYFSRLVSLARRKLRGLRRCAADEEDVALSAFDSFYRGAEQGRFPQLDDRDDLWALLVVITVRKAIDLRQRETSQKAGGGKVAGESALDGLLGPEEGGAGIERVVGAEPTPELAAQAADEVQRLLGMLPKEEVRAVALLKLEGYTNAEIAERRGCAEVTVERRLALIRSLWKESAPA